MCVCIVYICRMTVEQHRHSITTKLKSLLHVKVSNLTQFHLTIRLSSAIVQKVLECCIVAVITVQTGKMSRNVCQKTGYSNIVLLAVTDGGIRP